jgi:hypothetical protein
MKRLLVIAAAATVAVTAAVSGQTEGALDAQTLKGLELRSVGPALATGRVQDVEIDPRNPSVWYVATAFGGLWKTTNRGITFAPIFDDQGSFTLCCVVVDPRDSNTVWVGSGLQIHRRRQDLEQRRTQVVRAHRENPRRSAQLEHRLCRVAGSALVGRR